MTSVSIVSLRNEIVRYTVNMVKRLLHVGYKERHCRHFNTLIIFTCPSISIQDEKNCLVGG